MPPTATARAVLRLLYAAYAWLVLLFVVIPVAAAFVLLPGVERRRALARWGAGTVLRMIGSPVSALGTPPGPGAGATVVANHQSYLDGIILTAVLPPQYTFLIKREMVRVPIAGFVLGRLGSEFVDRSDAHRRRRSARRLVQAAIRGKALVVFPEGTFDAEPGLKPFRVGAFRAAWLGGLPVVPTVIAGARAKLPSGSWMPRPGPLTVEFCAPLEASAFADPTALLNAARAAMLARLGEPDLGDADVAGPDAEAGSEPAAALD